MRDDRPIRSFRTYRDPIATGDLVFVYGTLRDGQPNHGWLGSSERVGGTFETVDRYRLRDLGSFPAAEHVTGEPGAPGRGLVGEVYRVDDVETGWNLDHLEGNGRLYRRALRSVYIDGDLLLSRCRAWVFEIVRPRPDAPVIDSGDWSDRLPLVDDADDDADADADIEDDWNDDGFEW